LWPVGRFVINMAIISLSLPEKLLSELDELTGSGGYNNRSDTVRAAVRLLSAEHRQERQKKGRQSGVLLLIHDERDEAAFTEAHHGHEDIVKTSIHNQLGGGKCLQALVVEGDAGSINGLLAAIRGKKKAEYVKLFTA
jgi:CopG family transcriptional regulator, nickel-responsive regulator